MLQVAVFNAHPRRRVRKKVCSAYVRQVLRSEGRRRARVSVVFIDNAFSRRINKAYLGHDYATDVVSFPLEPESNLEGEIYVNLDRARSQAVAYGVSGTSEIARLVIHGTLHLLGYDDRTTGQSRRMKAREDALVDALVFRYKKRQQ